jgi:hypothetical protein
MEKMATWALETSGRIVKEHIGEEERGLDFETIQAAIAVALTSAYEDGMKTGNEVGGGGPVKGV